MSLLDPLVRPDEFFDRQAPQMNVASAAFVVFVTAVVFTLAFAMIGWSFSAQITATTTIDNPDRPPEWVCEQHGDDPDSSFGRGCDEPETKEVAVSTLVWDAWTDLLWLPFFGILVGWPLLAAGLHVGSWVAGGRGSFANTLTVAGWGTAPTIFQMLLVVPLAHVAFVNAEMLSDPGLAPSDLKPLFSRWSPAMNAFQLLLVSWEVYIWAYGLKHARSLSIHGATTVAVIVALIAVLL